MLITCSRSRSTPLEAVTTTWPATTIGLETLLPGALKLFHDGLMSLPQLFERLSLAPARLLGLDCGRLVAGAPADLVLFDPDEPYVLDRYKLQSKSKNTPFDRRLMTGRALKTWVGGWEVHGS